MSEETPAAGASAGALLRAAREKRGLHIAALAAAIKVAPRKLDALENDRWSELPDATFTRALAQTVCRSLKIDAKPVLDLLPPAEILSVEAGAGALNEPFHEHGARRDASWAALAVKPLVAAALLLMVAAVVVYLLPAGWWSPDRAPAVVSSPLPASAAAAQASAEPAEPTPAGNAAEAASAPAVAPAPVANVASEPRTTPGALPAPAAAASAAVPARAQTAASAAGTGSVVQIRAQQASWVEVRDAQGRALVSRTLQPGETVGLDGEPPFRLTIGNAAATELRFRGQPVALEPHTRDAVARLELK